MCTQPVAFGSVVDFVFEMWCAGVASILTERRSGENDAVVFVGATLQKRSFLMDWLLLDMFLIYDLCFFCSRNRQPETSLLNMSTTMFARVCEFTFLPYSICCALVFTIV